MRWVRIKFPHAHACTSLCAYIVWWAHFHLASITYAHFTVLNSACCVEYSNKIHVKILVCWHNPILEGPMPQLSTWNLKIDRDAAKHFFANYITRKGYHLFLLTSTNKKIRCAILTLLHLKNVWFTVHLFPPLWLIWASTWARLVIVCSDFPYFLL